MMAAAKKKAGIVQERRQSLTPSEKESRRIHARRRFKAVVHLVMANRWWLEETSGDTGGLSDDVKKNVMLLTRKKEKKSILALEEKSILCKPAEERTEEERTHLNRIIGDLKCFRRYPPQVKSKLAAVTYFFYFGPGRVIIKQDHPPISLYFILFGEVVVTQRIFDPIFNEWTVVTLGTMQAGNMFGEVSLLHGISRTATITTLTDCEFLCLRKEDFEVVLKASVMAQWEKIQSAMARFTYFDNWDEIARRECCILAKLKEYAKDETIFGDGIGLPNYAYFVIKGRCQLIEHMYIETKTDGGGNKTYKLYDPEKGRLKQEARELFRRERSEQIVRGMSEQIRREPSEKLRKNASAQLVKQPSGQLRTEPSEQLRKRSSAQLRRDASKQIREERSQQLRIKASGQFLREPSGQLQTQPSEQLRRNPSGQLKRGASGQLPEETREQLENEANDEPLGVADENDELWREPSEQIRREDSCEKQDSCIPVGEESSTTGLLRSKSGSAAAYVKPSMSRSATRASSTKLRGKKSSSMHQRLTSEMKLPTNVDIHYMQCCYLNELAVFGLGEDFTNRRVVAHTPVHCLLIPKYWLWQKNKDYVWSKVQQFLTNHIPTTQDVFKEFVENRRWQAHRERVTQQVLQFNHKINFNSIHNVPYSIRMADDLTYVYRKPKQLTTRRSYIIKTS